MTKRLLIISTQMELGGVQIRALSIQKQFSEWGVDTEICFLYKKRNIGEVNENVRWLADSPPRGLFSAIMLVVRLYRIIRHGNFDAVLGFAHYASPIATFLAWLAGVPVRVATQTNPPHKGKFGAVALDKICGTLGVYTANVAASQAIANCLNSYPEAYRRRLTVIPNGIRALTASVERAEARAVLGLSDGDFALLNCGRLSDQKNQSFLLDVVSGLPNEFHLRILGEGELRSVLQAKIDRLGIADRVKLIGEVDPERLADFLIAGDLFLFPSKFEAFGLAMVEAMSLGLPVICSDYPALVEVGGDAVESLPTVSSDLWVENIVGLSANAHRRAALAAQSSTRASTMDVRTMCKRFFDLMFRQSGLARVGD